MTEGVDRLPGVGVSVGTEYDRQSIGYGQLDIMDNLFAVVKLLKRRQIQNMQDKRSRSSNKDAHTITIEYNLNTKEVAKQFIVVPADRSSRFGSTCPTDQPV